MRFRVRHEIELRSTVPVRNFAAVLRLAPRSHDGQHVSDWRVDADLDCSLTTGQDAFGNVTQSFSAAGPLDQLVVSVAGDVETFDAAGLLRGAVERLPVEMFLRDTELTAHDAAVRGFAERVAAGESSVLGTLHALLEALHEAVDYAPDAQEATAAQAFAARRGSAADHGHLFIACARHLAIPSRFVSGYLARDGGAGALHAWAEAYVERLGWIGFDTVENICPQDRHIRVAASLDSLGAAFVRAARFGLRADVLSIVPLA